MGRWLAIVVVALGIAGWARLSPAGTQGSDAKPLKLPEWWKPADPLPAEKTNCVRCHLTAGRELTAPVREFARSAHDRANLSCNHCHGGNTKDDTSAHEEQHGFIGNKLSAHITACAECHPKEADDFRKGPHYWDLSKRINRAYPTCIDCHGNHDVAKPPPEFSLNNVCTDCHKQLDTQQPATASVVAENDRLWEVLRKVHAKDAKSADPTPAAFRRELNAVRHTTARLMHGARPLAAEQTAALNERARKLRAGLEQWSRKNE